MKKILFFAAFAALFNTAQAQERQITKDSTAISQIAAAFYEVRYLVYDNKDEEVLRTFLGDSATLNNYVVNRSIETANIFAAKAREVMNLRTVTSSLRDAKNALQAATGADLFKSMIALYYSEFVDNVGTDKAWQWRNGGIVELQVRLMGNGKLRFSGLPNVAGNITGDLLGNSWLRLNNYPTQGTDLLFYRQRRGRWFNIDKTVELRLSGLNIKQNR